MPGDRARNSQVEKFFKSDAVASHPVAVVREGIQNTLDAADAGPAHVRLSMGTVAASAAEPFTEGLFAHLDALRSHSNSIPTPDSDVPYLAFEDFNTTGLRGNPRQWEPIDETPNPFFNFFRGEGVSNKSDTQRGRHGVGKMVFSVASRARCIFGLTCTEEEGPLLMGTATLPLHRINGRSYHPDGWFGLQDVVGGGGQLTVPVTEREYLNSFADTFGLKRGTQNGLSIVVPWVDDTFDHQRLVAAVIEGYFWPILQGDLTVSVETTEDTSEITSSTLASELGRLPDETSSRLSPVIALAERALGRELHTVTCSGESERGKPKFTDESLSDQDREQLLEQLDSGETVQIRVPLTVRPKSRQAAEALSTFFDIFLCQDTSNDDGQILFIREGLIISQTRPRRCPGYRGLVIADDAPIAKFLGDAENPAHTEWQKDNVKDLYTYAPGTLDFIVQSVPNLLRLLASKKQEANTSIFIDLFSVPSREKDEPKSKSRKPKPKGPGESAAPDIDVPRRPRRLSLEHRPNGFVITRGAPESDRPHQIDVRIAYESRKGNPFKKYSPSDFDLARPQIQIVPSGCRIVHRQGNRMRIEVDEDDFQVAVTGFDPNRDIRVDARPMKAEVDDAATV